MRRGTRGWMDKVRTEGVEGGRSRLELKLTLWFEVVAEEGCGS